MKLQKKLLCLAMVGVMALAQVPLASIANTAKSSEVIYFSDDDPIELNEVGQTYDLSVVINSEDHDKTDLEFSSDKTDVVKVDGELLTAVGNGTATVTVSLNVATSSSVIKYSDKIEVIVKIPENNEEPENNGSSDKGTPSEVPNDDKADEVKDESKSNDDSSDKATSSEVPKDDKADEVKDETTSNNSSSDQNTSNEVTDGSTSNRTSNTSSSSSSGGSSGGGSSSSSSVGSNTTSTTSPSGATVVTDVTTGPNGEKITSAKISLGGKTMTVQTTEITNADGSKVTYTTVSGDPSGLTFNGIGTVSADGLTLAGVDGVTYYVCSAPCYLITMADGSTIGCFLDPATGLPIATGTYMLYFQLGADGQMHAHWVNPAGFFVTGLQTINGITANFNAFGEMIG